MMSADQDYGVRVIRARGFWRVGQVIYPEGAFREDLIRRGFVEAVAPPPPAPVTKNLRKKD